MSDRRKRVFDEPVGLSSAMDRAMRSRVTYDGARDVTSDAAGEAAADATTDAGSDTATEASRDTARDAGTGGSSDARRGVARGGTRAAAGDVTSGTGSGVSRPRRRSNRRPAPSAATSVALTVRFDPDEAVDIDAWVNALRDELGWKVEKAEIVRTLIDLARSRPAVRRALLSALGWPARR